MNAEGSRKSTHKHTTRKRIPYLQNRELSWLEFNKRVLDQGADPMVPLFDRLSFLSIFWSNLQEFFMVRVGSLTDLSLVKKLIIDSKSRMTPAEQLSAIYARCHELYPYYETCYKNLKSQLGEEHIHNLKKKDLSEEQLSFIQDYFDMNVMPFLSPQIVNARHPFPHLENGALYIVVRLDEEKGPKNTKKKAKEAKAKKNSKEASNVGAEGVTLGLIPLPRQCERIVRLPGDGLQFMLLEHAIEMFVPDIFSMYKVKHTNIICVTRNADLDATEGMEELGEDYREHMKRILKKRSRLAPVRLESERELSQTVKKELLSRLELKNHQTFVTSVPLDMSYVSELIDMVPEDVRKHLVAKPFKPHWPGTLDKDKSLIQQVSDHDILLSYPYESMDPFVQLLREAAHDPNVISIKITLYRLSRESHVAEALIAAAEAGKEVTALFELRARFDESNNIDWSQRFEQAGCHVIYGFRNYKVHSKICSIIRQTDDGLQHITQLGTGNYNEKTAKLYTDFSYITTNPKFGRDAVRYFTNMALENISDDYSMLWVAPLQIKSNILDRIDGQIKLAQGGKPANIFFKTNSIADKDVIEKIVEASKAGVECTLLVRGISCILPGIKGYTENVRVASIVGRLLEHSRIFAFGPLDDNPEVYLSSADLMTRNMDKRIEIAWPLPDGPVKEEVVGYIGTCLADTAKLRDLMPNGDYTSIGFYAQDVDGKTEMFDSQAYLIEEAKNKKLEEVELEAAVEIDDVFKERKLAFDNLEVGHASRAGLESLPTIELSSDASYVPVEETASLAVVTSVADADEMQAAEAMEEVVDIEGIEASQEIEFDDAEEGKTLEEWDETPEYEDIETTPLSSLFDRVEIPVIGAASALVAEQVLDQPQEQGQEQGQPQDQELGLDSKLEILGSPSSAEQTEETREQIEGELPDAPLSVLDGVSDIAVSESVEEAEEPIFEMSPSTYMIDAQIESMTEEGVDPQVAVSPGFEAWREPLVMPYHIDDVVFESTVSEAGLEGASVSDGYVSPEDTGLVNIDANARVFKVDDEGQNVEMPKKKPSLFKRLFGDKSNQE